MQRSAMTRQDGRRAALPCILLLLALSVREGVDAGGDLPKDGDGDLVVFSVKPSRWADNLYPPSEQLGLALRVNTGGPWEARLEWQDGQNRTEFRSGEMMGGGREEAVYWLTPTWPGLVTVRAVVIAWPREEKEEAFSRHVSFAVAAVHHRGEVGQEAAKRSGIAQCYSRSAAGGMDGGECDVLVHKMAYSAPSVVTREELRLLSAFSPTWCGVTNDDDLRANFPQRVALPPAPSLGSCAFVEGPWETLEGLGLGDAIDAHDTVIRVGAPAPWDARVDGRQQGSRTDVRFMEGRHLEEAGAPEAAAREIASKGARVLLSLSSSHDCRRFALEGPLGLLNRQASDSVHLLSPSFMHTLWASWADRDSFSEASPVAKTQTPSMDALAWAAHECETVATFAPWHAHMILPPLLSLGSSIVAQAPPETQGGVPPKQAWPVHPVLHRRLVQRLHAIAFLQVGGRQTCSDPQAEICGGGGAPKVNSPHMLPMLITGCGFSGTGYMNHLFAEAHYEVGHESIGRHGMVSHMFAKGAQKNLAGWSHANFSFVAHIVRHSLKVVSSWVMLAKSDWEPDATVEDDMFVPTAVAQLNEFLQRERLNAPGAIRALDWWNVQNARAGAAATYRFRIEDINLPNSTIEVELCQRASIPGCEEVDWKLVKSRLPPGSRNKHGGERLKTSWQDLDAAVEQCASGGAALREACAAVVREARGECRRFGYHDC